VVLTLGNLFYRLKILWQLKEDNMSDSVYKIITLVGTSPKSWEEAATAAVEIAAKTLRELRISLILCLYLRLNLMAESEHIEGAFRVEIGAKFLEEGLHWGCLIIFAEILHTFDLALGDKLIRRLRGRVLGTNYRRRQYLVNSPHIKRVYIGL
jgi:hypothetical protein